MSFHKNNDFDSIVPVYDRLGNMVFGKTLIESAIHYFSEIESDSNILVLGGGTGKLLKELPKNSHVTYLDKSSKMLMKAESFSKRVGLDLQIQFIYSDFLDWKPNQEYDVVICPFFLDVFLSENLGTAIDLIKKSLYPKGVLLVSDFQVSENPKHRFLIQMMHIFFRLYTGLESKSLQNINEEIQKAGFKLLKESFFRNNLIFSRIYKIRETSTSF